MPADFKRVKEIFLEAVEQAGQAEREACLRRACGDDDALRRRVELLLRRHDQAHSILERPPFDAAAMLAPPSAGTDGHPAPQQEAAGTRLGPYKLLQKIGEGGMGVRTQKPWEEAQLIAGRFPRLGSMKVELPEIRPDERTPLVEGLLAVVQQLLDRVQQLEETVQQLRDENALLKGLKPRAKISPSRLESPTPSPLPKDGKRPGSDKRSKNSQLLVPADVRLHPDPLPPGAVLKSYEPYVVQELTIEAKATRYLRPR